MNFKSLMAALVVCGLGSYLAVKAARSQQTNHAAEKPRLVLDAADRDLGTVAAGILRADFSLRNAGSRRLIVREDVCSACNPAEWIIEPGASENLTIRFDVTGLEGRVRRTCHYTTSDPLLPRLALVVQATVQEPHVAHHP